MSYSLLYLPLQKIRQVVPQEKPSVNNNKSARNYGRGNKKRRGSPHGIPDTHTSEYWRRTNKVSTDQFTSIGQWKCGVCGVKPWRNPARTPHADDEKLGINGTDRLRICAAAKPRQLTVNTGNRLRTSARNLQVPTKPSAIQEIDRRVRRHKKVDCHRGETIIPVPTGGPANRILTGVSAINAC